MSVGYNAYMKIFNLNNFKGYIIRKIPPVRLQSIVDFKNYFLGGYSKHYYSQFGEDIVLKNIFKNKNDGFYVDVGAHHPRRYSNTHLLYKIGWRGINIDPNPYTISLFNKYRPDDINIQCGVSNVSQEAVYFAFSDPAINTFSKISADKWLKKDWVKLIKKEKIPLLRLDEILKNHLRIGRKIDLMTIDAEGLDLEVLKSNNWDIFVPRVIIVESHDFSIDALDKNEIYRFLIEKSYKLHSFVGPSLIFTLN